MMKPSDIRNNYSFSLIIFNSEIRSTGVGPRLNSVLLSGSTTHHGKDYFYPYVHRSHEPRISYLYCSALMNLSPRTYSQCRKLLSLEPNLNKKQQHLQ
jgi:hypothetical protein